MKRVRFGHMVRALIALAQFGLPFSIGKPSTPVGRFRALARRSRFAASRPATRRLARLVMTLSWPFGALVSAMRHWSRMRARAQTPHGAGVLLDMYWLALRHSIPPLEYAAYRFNDPMRRRDVHQYVYWNDLPGLAALRTGAGADNRDVQDKDRFAAICAARDLPHVETLAVFEGGRQTRPATPFVPSASALWSKALRLKDGASGTKWTRDGDSYRDTIGRKVPATQLVDVLRRQVCIVQPFIDNHPDVAHMSNGALASLRIVTGTNRAGEAEYVAALLALPHGTCTTSAGGILCSIEQESGQIRRAALLAGELIERHPDTGLRLIDAELPFWAASVSLAQRAHAAGFARFPFLGWDIALTANGPVLLETNSGWGALFHQLLDGPLGHTAFSRLVALRV
jgi:Sugar-transfer associated ATP-grasp